MFLIYCFTLSSIFFLLVLLRNVTEQLSTRSPSFRDIESRFAVILLGFLSRFVPEEITIRIRHYFPRNGILEFRCETSLRLLEIVRAARSNEICKGDSSKPAVLKASRRGHSFLLFKSDRASKRPSTVDSIVDH